LAGEVAFVLLDGPVRPAQVREARQLMLQARHVGGPEHAEAA
jgi:hypothetical protein